MRECEEARCSGGADGEKGRRKERKSDGRQENRGVEKLMSRLLCDGACPFQCQPALPHPLSELPLSLLFVSISCSLSPGFNSVTLVTRLYITRGTHNC